MSFLTSPAEEIFFIFYFFILQFAHVATEAQGGHVT